MIAYELAQAGLDARTIDGWVYVALPGGRLLWIGAEYGASLDAEVRPSRPAWFDAAPELARPAGALADPPVTHTRPRTSERTRTEREMRARGDAL